MLHISDYSLNYSQQIGAGKMTIFDFLSQCRRLGTDAASIHIRNLPTISTGFLKKVRRAYLDNGLSMSMFTVSTNFGNPRQGERGELEKAFPAIRVGMFLGAPILRVFAGSPKNEADREEAFQRAVDGIRKVVEEAAEWGLPVGLQNHNHGALCRTGAECIRFIKTVNHPNLTMLLDTGQFAGSKGASGEVPEALRGEDYMESIRMTASLARHVRMKFYNPRPNGSEPYIDYPEVFDILRGVHYSGIIDIVYEPARHGGGPIEEVMPRIISYLRKQIQEGQG
jgi:sugar phosphate isomerase/epimerase